MATSLIFNPFQISGNPINFLLYISVNSSSTSTNLRNHPVENNKCGLAFHRTGGNQPNSRGEKHKQTKQFAQTVAQMFNGLFTSVYTDQRKRRKNNC